MTLEQLKETAKNLETSYQNKKQELEKLYEQLAEKKNNNANQNDITDLENKIRTTLQEFSVIEVERNNTKFDIAEYYRTHTIIEIYIDESGNKYISKEAIEKTSLTMNDSSPLYTLANLNGDFYSLSNIQFTELINDNSIVVNDNRIKDNTVSLKNNQPVIDNQTREVPLNNLEYQKLLEARISKVRSKLNALRQKEDRDITGHVAEAVKGFEIELERLTEEVANLSRPQVNSLGEFGLEYLDEKRSVNSEKQDYYKEQIKELKELKDSLEKARNKRKINRRIERYEKKIARLKKANVFYSNVQRTIMYPKYKLEAKKRSLLARAEGRVKAYENKQQDNENIKNNLDTIFKDSPFNGIRQKYYDLKGIYYQKKIARSNDILTEMQNKNNIVTMSGARITSLSKSYLNKIRQSNDQQRIQSVIST